MFLKPMSPPSVHFFTIVARNYLAYAFVLGRSVLRHHPTAKFSIFLMDDSERTYQQEIERNGFSSIYPDQIAISHYHAFVFKYNVTEASTGVKPFVIQFLFRQGAERVIYLDPDILCFRTFDEVIEALNSHSIVLTPHNTTPIPDDIFPDDDLYLTCGAYNLGFVALRNDAVANQFVEWWCKRLDSACLDAREMGLFVDQKWVDLVPAYFERVSILKSLAYNIAYWNVHHRRIVKQGATWRVLPSDERVAFFHFSGIRPHQPTAMTKYGPRGPLSAGRDKRRVTFEDQPHLADLYREYAALVIEAGHDRYCQLPYAFGQYSNGEPVSQLERALFLVSPWWHDAQDPFAASSPDSFLQRCRRAGVRSASSNHAKTANNVVFDEVRTPYAGAFGIIRLFMRVMLFALGPTLYGSFAKYVRQQFLLVNHGFVIDRKGE